MTLTATLTKAEVRALASAMFYRMQDMLSSGTDCDDGLPDAQGREDLMELSAIARLTAMLGEAETVTISIAAREE